MLNIHIGSTNLYYLVYYFIIFSFLGWLMETVRVSLKSGYYVNRGFATGPYCPIYGFGMCFVILLLSEFKDNVPALFVFGMIITTALEYFTAVGLEKIFKAKWWDYSYKRFNFQGRISLDISVAWGVLSVVMIEFVVPLIDVLVEKIPIIVGEIFGALIVICIAADTAMTARSIVSLTKVAEKLAEAKAEIRTEWDKFAETFSENIREYIDVNELKEKLALTDDIKTKLKERRRLLNELNIDELKAKFSDRDFTAEKLAAINKIRDMYAKYVATQKLPVSKTHKRILGAFPGLELNNKEMQEVIKGIKEKLKAKR